MKKNIKKIFVSLIAATTIFVSSGQVLANKITVNMPYTIYQSIDKENISSGVVHERIKKFTTTGWWNINVLRIDLSDPYTEVKGLINPDGMPKRDKVSNMVQQNNAVAGINGDFFSYSPVPWSLGPLISDGNLISLSREQNPLPGFFIDFLNQGKIDYFNTAIEAVNIDTGNKISVNVINNIISTDFQTVTLLDKNWGPKSIGTQYHNDVVEVVVNNGIVVDIRIGKEAVDIPENGYVLLVRGARTQELLNLGIGHRIELKVSSTPNIDDIRFAIGGGSYILENGKLRNPDISSPGNHPRTGIGISQDGKEIILVTIDGRNNSYIGVTQEMFGAILRNLGAYNAINLDGGGSTTMAIKPKDAEKAIVVNAPSEDERLVVNGVGVFSNAPIGELSYIKLSTDDNNMFVNTTRQLTVKGYDKYHNPIELDKSKLIFSLEGVKGNISSYNFKAKSQGKAKITVRYGDIINTMDINVLGHVKDITTELSKLNIEINSEKTLPIFYGKDINGHQAKIYPEDIDFSTINDIGHVEDGVFYSEAYTIAGVLVAKIDDGLKNIIVTVGSDGKLIEGFETLNNFSFASYPNTVLGEINLSNDAKEGSNSVSLKYDFSNGENSRAAYLRLMNGENIGLTIDGIPRKLGLWVNGHGTGGWLRGTIKDNKGNSHKIDFEKTMDWTGWQYLIANIPENISYPIVLEDIYLVETNSINKQSGEVLLDGLTAFYPPTLGNIVLPTPSCLQDTKNTKAEVQEDGFSFAVVMEPKGLNDLVQYDANSKIIERVNKHKIAVFLNSISEEFAKGLKNYARINAFGDYNKNKHNDVFYLHVNTEKGGIRATNPEQWTKLINDLKDREENNIVLFLSTPIFGTNGFKDHLEADLLHKYLVETMENGKNIFVVHGGSSNTSLLRDGIRYIELNTKNIKNPEDIYNLSIAEFIVNGSDITYEINPLFEKPSIKVTP